MAAIQNAMVIFPAAAFVAQYSAADDTGTAQQSVPLGRKYDACRHQTSADGEIAHRDHFQRVFWGGLIIAKNLLRFWKKCVTIYKLIGGTPNAGVVQW